MSHARRYHEPGVGSRTGMRIAEHALDLDDFFQAGRQALIGSARSSVASRRSSVTSVASTSSRVSTAASVEQSSGVHLSRRESDGTERARSAASKSLSRPSGPMDSEFVGQLSGYASSTVADLHLHHGGEYEEEGTAPGCSTLMEEERSVLSERDSNAGPSAPSRKKRSSTRRSDTEYGGDARSTADMQLYDQEEEMVAFDRTRMSQSSRMSLASVAEEGDVEESASVVRQEYEASEVNSVIEDELEEASIAEEEQEVASLAASYVDNDLEVASLSASFIDEEEQEEAASIAESNIEEEEELDEGEGEETEVTEEDEDSRHSAQENYSAAMSASDAESNGDFTEGEEEATITTNQTVSDTTTGKAYGRDDQDGHDENDDASTNADSQMYDDNDVSQPGLSSTRSVARSVLSEKDSNVPVTSKKRAKTMTTTKAKTKRGMANDDDDGQATPKARKKAVPAKAVDGRVVERIPSSFHRRDFASAQQEGEDDGAVRRGTRYRYKPLEYWRGERARFGRMSLPKSREQRGAGEDADVGDDTIDADAFEDNVLAVPPPVVVLKEIIRIPRAEGEGTFAGLKLPKKRDHSDKPRGVRRGGSREVSASLEPDPTQPNRYAEEGWDKDTSTHARVIDASMGEERDMQVACTSSQLRPRMAEGCSFGFEKVFVVEDFMATGVLFLLVDGEKPLKNSKDNYYTFTVLEGCVRVTLHETQFTIAPQGMFFVPRGNEYSIQNISKRVARLAFTQAKRPSGKVATGRTMSSDPASV